MINLASMTLPAAAAAVTVLALSGCTAPPAQPSAGPDAVLANAPMEPVGPDRAAALAVLASPRVRAAAHRLEASTHRERAVAAPPDPTIALSLGVPLDGLGGSPVSLSIMEGIAWLFAADRIGEAAARERSLAARELVAATVEVAAEARSLARALVAAHDAHGAAESAADARAQLLRAEEAALAVGESTPARIAARTRDDLSARAEADRTGRRVRTLGLELASMIGCADAPVVVSDADHLDAGLREIAPRDSLAVARARARLARAEAVLAEASGPGRDSRAGAAIGRDLEDRDSANFTLELSLPLFRRGHELAALRAEVDAERAELEEAERATLVANARALADAHAAAATAALGIRSALAARGLRDIVAEAQAAGEATRIALLEAESDAAEARIEAAEQTIALAQAIARLEMRSTEMNAQEAQR